MILVAGPGSVAGKTIAPYSSSGVSFTGTGDPKYGPFSPAKFLAVNDATGNIYVMDNGNGGLLRQFDAAGVPVPFSDPGLDGESAIVLGPWVDQTFGIGGGELVVDNTGGPTQGNIFAARIAFSPSKPLLFGYKPSGESLGENWPICGLDCGIADHWLGLEGVGVDPDGDPWVSSVPFFGTPPHEINPFDLTGVRHSTKETFLIGQGGHDIFGDKCCKEGSTALTPRRFVFDNDGNLYASAGSIVGCQCGFRILKYDPEKNLLNPLFTAVMSHTSGGPGLGQIAMDRNSGNIFLNYGNRIDVYDKGGKQIDSFGLGTLTSSFGLAVNSTTDDVYVTNGTGPNKVEIYKAGAPVTVPDVSTGGVTGISQETATLHGVVDPDEGGDTTDCYFEYGVAGGAMSNTVPCDIKEIPSAGGPQQVTAEAKDLGCQIPPPTCSFLPTVKGNKLFYRLVADNAAGPPQTGEIKGFRNSDPPIINTPTVNDVNSDGVDIDLNVDPEGGETNIRVEYGTSPAYGSSMDVDYEFPLFERPDGPKDFTLRINGLQPSTTYHYKVVAENPSGPAESSDRTFTTFQASDFDDSCPNALTRQQTGAAQLLECRAYELVSAADQGGYNVESDLAPNQSPFPGYPHADGKVLYSVHAGGIPNTGSPTIRGIDPYVATRGMDGWTTKYVGIPVTGTPSSEPFSSTLAGADSSLSAFAFGGPDLCDPCFEDGTSGVPIRLPNGDLVQGMAGSLPVSDPTPAGELRKPLSADGTHLVFGSEDKFEVDGSSNSLSIYVRNLLAGTTRVVSKTPAGAPMTGEIAQLDISANGSRVLIGEHVSTDLEGNDYYRLFMNVDGAKTIAVTPGSTSGALFAGMSSDGSEVYFATSDALSGDTDSSADIYRADISATAATWSRVSTGAGGAGDTDSCTPQDDWNSVAGPNCDAVAIAGGGGVPEEGGSIYFLSPERLDGNGTDGQPNLYRANADQGPEFVVTLEVDNPTVEQAISDAGSRDTSGFQVNAPGDVAAFTTTLSLKPDFENRGSAQVYRHDSGTDSLICVSCPVTNAPAAGDGGLASNGLSITDDGRIFFNSVDQLVLRDSNGKQDAYEWVEGVVELISTGTNENPSSLLSVTADGVDALFFTRESRVPQDKNGPVVKIYDAREDGGFFLEATPQPCKASDECHGASSVPAAPAIIQSTQGTPGQVAPKIGPKRCRKGFVRRNGKCVRKRGKNRSAKKRRTKRTNNSTRRNG